MKLKQGYPLIALSLFLAIAVISSLPTQDKFVLHTQGRLHPWLHVLAFGVLTFALVSSVKSSSLRVVIVMLMLTFGWGTEFVEHLRDKWPVETRDVLLDGVGVLLGAVVARARSSRETALD